MTSPVGAGGHGAGGPAAGAGGSEGGGALVGPCPLGATAECTVHHPGGCATGVQHCVDGTWSGCTRSVSSDRQRSLDDDAARCGDDGTTANVCDPECRGFAPDPPDLDGGTTGVVADWETGSLGELPAGVIADGIEEPCNDARDCQFDHRCSPASGRCEPFAPGDAVAACESGPASRPDLTLGVPCADTVPLCNRGPVGLTASETDGIQLKWRSDPNPSMEGCNIGNATVCDVPAVELAPGACISVPCSMPSGVYVFADHAPNAECECGNNWTYNVDGACGEPACGGSVSTASEVPLTLFLAIDTSGSMDFHRDCPYSVGCEGTCKATQPNRNCTGSCSGGVCSTGRGPSCCWDSASQSRWDAIHPALEEFVEADESAGLGVVMRFWPSGRCADGACDAISPFPACDAGACAFGPCTARAGDVPAGDTLDPSCNDTVEDVCAQDGLERCCGGWPGACAADPCEAQATSLAACDDGGSAGVRAVCDRYGLERCCGGPFTTAGAWGLDQSPCTVASADRMRCRTGSGNVTDCTQPSYAPPAGSRARVARTVCATTPSCCTTGWTAACRDAFASAWQAAHGAPPCSPARWDATCVAAFADETGSSTCTRSWDQACVDAYVERSGGQDGCNHPSVPDADRCAVEATCPLRLTEDAAPVDASEATFLAAMDDVDPDGGTPSRVALQGAADFCRNLEQQLPGERCVVVFVSDGAPSVCGSESDTLAAAAAAHDGGDGVHVYAISVPGVAPDFMHGIADEGGTGQAFIVSPDATATRDFLDALLDIRNAFACSYTLADGVDPALVDVRWNDGASSVPLVRVADVTGCGAVGSLGYYFASSTEVVLCAGTCDQVRVTTGSNIEIEIACASASAPATAYDQFTAAGTCLESGTFPKWTILHHTADVPAGSSIDIDARTRFDAGRAWSHWVDVVTITEVNESSMLSDPTSLEEALGPDALAEDIELRFVTTVDGGAPDLVGYEVQYTCSDTE